jgi:hypothetical protein
MQFRRLCVFSLIAGLIVLPCPAEGVTTGQPARPKYALKPLPVTVHYAETLRKNGKPDIVPARITLAVRSDGSTALHRLVYSLDGLTKVWLVHKVDGAGSGVGTTAPPR